MQNAKNRINHTYTENHHIVPRCMGGSNDKDNMVRLTAKEHFIVHVLLTKCVNEQYISKMWLAVWRFKCNPTLNNERYINSRQISIARENVGKFISKLHTGKSYVMQDYHKEKIRQARKKQVISKESYEKSAATHRDMIWMNDGIRSYKIRSNEVQTCINKGYVLGRLSNYITDEYRQNLSNKTNNQWQKVKQTGHTSNLIKV